MHVAAVYRSIYVNSVLVAPWICTHALYALLSIYVLHFYMAMSLPSVVLFPWRAQTVQCCCGSWWRWAWSWGGPTSPATRWRWWRGVLPRTTSPSTTTARRGGTSGSSRASSRRGRWRSPSCKWRGPRVRLQQQHHPGPLPLPLSLVAPYSSRLDASDWLVPSSITTIYVFLLWLKLARDEANWLVQLKSLVLNPLQ